MQIFVPRAISAALLVCLSVLTASLTPTADALNVRLYGINYNSRRGPDWADWNAKCKPTDVINNDMKLIKENSDSVRIYSLVDCNQGLPIARAVKQYGLKLALGLWTTKDPEDLEKELVKLGEIIDNGLIGDHITGLHIGSESIYRKDVTAATAIQYVNRVRSYLAARNVQIPLTIADVVDSYAAFPELIDAVDYVSINQFSFWERTDVTDAVPTMLDRIQPIRKLAALKNKQLVIGETGWSSQGSDPEKASVASPANQAKFFQDFYAMATAHNLPYYWFVAFDSLWRVTNGDHEIEGYFGVWNEQNQLKANFAGLQVAAPRVETIVRSVGSQLLLTQDDHSLTMTQDAAKATDWLAAEQQTFYYDASSQTLRSKGNDRCLDTYEHFDGGSVRLYACIANEPNQKWIYEQTTQRLRHGTYTSLCLDTDVNANNKLQVYGCSDNNSNQQWVLAAPGSSAGPSPSPSPSMTPAPVSEAPAPVTDGSVRFFTKESASTHYAQLVRFDSGDVGIGYSATGAALSEWWFRPGGNTNLVQAKNSNLCLDAYERWDGGRVHVWTCNANEPNQQWTLDEQTGQLKHLTHVGFCLDADQTTNKVSLYGCHLANNNQVWRKISNVARGVRVHSHVVGDAVLTPQDDGRVLGLPAAARDMQQWFWDAAAQRLTSKWRDECLDAYEAMPGGRVHTYHCLDGERNQQWRFNAAVNAIEHVAHVGYCLAYNNMNDKLLELAKCDATAVTQRMQINMT